MRIGYTSSLERGDTIVEVIFAIAVFSFVAVSSLMLMNKGIAIGEKALEITLVRQQITAQAEAIRYIHEARVVSPSSNFAATWNRIRSNYGQSSASAYGVSGNECSLPVGSGYKPFILNARTAELWSSLPSMSPSANSGFPPYAQVIYNDDSSIREAYGLWVEAVPSSTLLARRYIDFHIRACWPAPGSSVPMTIGTIVRLYDPVSV